MAKRESCIQCGRKMIYAGHDGPYYVVGCLACGFGVKSEVSMRNALQSWEMLKRFYLKNNSSESRYNAKNEDIEENIEKVEN